MTGFRHSGQSLRALGPLLSIWANFEYWLGDCSIVATQVGRICFVPSVDVMVCCLKQYASFLVPFNLSVLHSWEIHFTSIPRVFYKCSILFVYTARHNRQLLCNTNQAAKYETEQTKYDDVDRVQNQGWALPTHVDSDNWWNMYGK